MQTSTSFLNKDNIFKITGVLLIFVIWQVLSLCFHRIVVPSPAETLFALMRLLESGALLDNLIISFQRQITGLAVGLVIGLISGIAAGFSRQIEYIVQPLINTLLTIPPIVVTVMAMVWLGMGSQMVILLVALLVWPVMFINTVEGFKSIDENLLQMAQVFKVPARIRIRKIYLPGVIYSLLAGISLSTASSIRLTVMAELLGASEGIGQKIAISRSYLETDSLFAWVLILVLIVFLLKYLIIRPLNNIANRWRSNVNQV